MLPPSCVYPVAYAYVCIFKVTGYDEAVYIVVEHFCLDLAAINMELSS